MYPTPYRWTTDEGLTHIFYSNHLPPGFGFGWSSLCNELQLPIEGTHFELDEGMTKEDITCRHCHNLLDGETVDLDDDSIARVIEDPSIFDAIDDSFSLGVDGCLVRFKRDEDGVITSIESVCETLHRSLSFEPDSFSGNLNDQVEEVCTECWQSYIDRQWRSDVEGAELRVEVSGEDGRSEYFAARAEAIRCGREEALRLVSENGLEKEILGREIETITLTPAQRVDY